MTKDKTVTMSRAKLEQWYRQMRDLGLEKMPEEIMEILAAPVVERQPEPVAAQVRFRPTRKELIGYREGKDFGPWQYTDLDRVDMNQLCYIDSVGYETEKRVLFASPPAPVVVPVEIHQQLIEMRQQYERANFVSLGKLLTACLDKVKEMNQ